MSVSRRQILRTSAFTMAGLALNNSFLMAGMDNRAKDIKFSDESQHQEKSTADRENRSVRICVDRIVTERHSPARAMAQKAASARYQRTARTIIQRDNLSPGTLGDLDPDHPLFHARMALISNKTWENGKTLKCRFLDGESEWQKQVEAKAKKWEPFANIKFQFGDFDDAEIRISFFADAGSWSAIGTDALVESFIPRYQPTMNFGWLRSDTPDDEYERVVVHEFGHALGCIHEHQSPTEHLKWDPNAVYKYFSGPPNYWSKDDIDQNVLQKYSPEGVQATPFDRQSIMLYQFSPQLFLDHKGTPLNKHMSPKDKIMIAQLYPKS